MGSKSQKIVEYSFDDDNNSKRMFEDAESVAELTSSSRRYPIARVLYVKAINNTTIQVANFAPVDIEDATILVTIKNMPNPIQLFKIKKIRAHGTREIAYSFIEGDTSFLDINNNRVSLGAFKESGIPPANATFDFIGDNELIKKLKKLSKLKWAVKYHDFDPNNSTTDDWKEDISPKDVRRLSGLMINIAYLLQADATRASFVNETIHGNDGGTLFTTEQKQQIYQRYLDIPYFQVGVTANVSGFGGGSAFGLAEYAIGDYITKDISEAFIPAIGLMLGYSDESTMTYPREGKGASFAISREYQKMLSNDDFPINMKNYFKPGDLLD